MTNQLENREGRKKKKKRKRKWKWKRKRKRKKCKQKQSREKSVRERREKQDEWQLTAIPTGSFRPPYSATGLGSRREHRLTRREEPRGQTVTKYHGEPGTE